MSYDFHGVKINAVVTTDEPVYSEHIITPAFNEKPFLLSPKLNAAAETIFGTLNQRNKRVFDGQGVGLQLWHQDDSGQLMLWFRSADYLSMFGGHGAAEFLTDPELQDVAAAVEREFRRWRKREISCPFSRRPLLACSLITGDNKFIIMRRSEEHATQAAQFQSAIVGAIRPDRGDCFDRGPNIVLKAFLRTAEEELGINLREHTRFSIMFGGDTTRFAQPIIAGAIRTNMTSDTILSNMAGYAKETWEHTNVIVSDFCAEGVLKVLGRHRMSAACQLSLVCAAKMNLKPDDLETAAAQLTQ